MNYFTNGKIYTPKNLHNLDQEELQYLSYFQILTSVFNQNDYDILINREDYGRMLFVDVINRISFTTVKIYLKYASIPIDNPININVLQNAISHFQSRVEEKLILNRRSS